MEICQASESSKNIRFQSKNMSAVMEARTPTSVVTLKIPSVVQVTDGGTSNLELSYDYGGAIKNYKAGETAAESSAYCATVDDHQECLVVPTFSVK